MKRLGVRCALAIVALLTASPAVAQWTSLGAMPAPRQEANRLTFRNRQGTVVVTVIEPHIFRVRFAPRQELGRDHSYSVVPACASGSRRGLQDRARPVDHHDLRPADDDSSRSLPHRDRRRAGELARRRRPAEWHRVLRQHRPRLEAAARRRAGLRPRREDRRFQQARPAAGRLQLHDVEQRHLRVRHQYRSDLRVGPVLPRAARRAQPRHLFRQHVPQQLRRRPPVAGPAVVRRRRRRAQLLLHLRSRSQERDPRATPS